MTVFKKEMKQNTLSLCLWAGITAFMIILCVVIFPDMKGQMDNVNEMFANMGGFTDAFGMDRVSFGEIMGFYAIECGNVLGIGGGFFAALLGISALAKEEKDRTAEFLLTHPIKRNRVLTEKLLAVLIQIILFNAAVILGSIVSFSAIGETIAWKPFLLLHLAFFVLQIEIACICFGISAFLKRNSAGVGLGLAALFYFLNIVHNLSDNADLLKYITPYAYAEASSVVADEAIDLVLLSVGAATAVLFTVVGFIRYNRKDIAA